MSNSQDNATGSGNDEEETAAVRVECYAGHRAEESPRRFFIGTRRIEMIQIIDRWLGPDHSHFKVRGDDGGIYNLRYNPDSDAWKMTLYDKCHT